MENEPWPPEILLMLEAYKAEDKRDTARQSEDFAEAQLWAEEIDRIRAELIAMNPLKFEELVVFFRWLNGYPLGAGYEE